MCITDPQIIAQKIPDKFFHFSEKIVQAGYQIYLVGGALRDIILGNIPTDYDFATSALPEEIIQIFPKVIPTGLAHGTVSVKYEGELIEVTTFRIDGKYSDNRRPETVDFSNRLEDDIVRRDFTINAIAYNLSDRRLIDYTGGIQDIKEKLIKAIGCPDQRFSEDSLRIIRAIRFSAQFGFKIEKNTLLALKNKTHLLSNIAKERIKTEWVKTIFGKSLSVPFSQLFSSGIADYVLPDFCVDYLSRKTSGELKSFITNIMLYLPSDLDFCWEWRLATMLAGNIFDDYLILEKYLQDNRYSRLEITRIISMIKAINQPLPDSSRQSIRIYLKYILPFDWYTVDLARRASGYSPQPEYLIESLNHESEVGIIASHHELKISGNTLKSYFKIDAGPWIGTILKKLEWAVVEAPEINNEKDLIQLARNHLVSIGEINEK